MTTAAARKVLIEFAESMAAIERSEGKRDKAAAYDTLAAELRGPSDLAIATRLLADDYQEAGYVETPDWLRAIADITEGRFACGHEVPGPPVDGREVDRAPDLVFVPALPADMLPPTQHVAEYRLDDYRQTWDCRCPLLEDHISLTPMTDGGVSADPPGTTPPSPHLWLRRSSGGAPCFCLIGDDHVAEPRFEKES
jgi:hypothetical protein